MNLVRLQYGGGSSIEPYTVIVSLDEEFKGQPVTLTQGTEIMRNTCPMTAPYEVEFKPMNDGVWVASSTTKYGNVVSVDTEPLLEWGTYNVPLKSGFSFQKWLNRGRVEKTFTSLNDVLADEPTVRQLMTVHDSVDYLVTALSNDTNIANEILGNDICAKWINLRDYAFDMLEANANVKAVMDSVDKYGYGEWALIDGTWQPKGAVPVMTSNTAPYGVASASSKQGVNEAYKAFSGSTWASAIGAGTNAWLQYKFVNPTKIKLIHLTGWIDPGYDRDGVFKLQASNDDSSFKDITTNFTLPKKATEPKGIDVIIPEANQNYYFYYRLVCVTYNDTYGSGYAGVNDFKLYGRSLNVSVPKMDGNNSPFGVASASSELSSQYASFMAFDGTNNNSDDCWIANDNTAKIQYDFGKPIVVKFVELANRLLDIPSEVRTFAIEGSDDDFNSIKYTSPTLTNSNTSSGGKSAYEISNLKPCRYWRLRTITNDGTNYVAIGILNFYGLDYSEKEFAQDGKVEYIYDHDIELMALTKTSSSALVTFDTTNCKTLRATLGKYATTSDKIQCGSANATLNGNPFSLGLDITNVNGNNATGFGNINVANMGDTSLWVENK